MWSFRPHSRPFSPRVSGAAQDTEIGFWHTYADGVDTVFVDHQTYGHYKDRIYGGERHEIQFRCALLCQAAIEAVWKARWRADTRRHALRAGGKRLLRRACGLHASVPVCTGRR